MKEDLHVEEGVQASGQNVKFSSKDYTLADRTTVRGGSTAEIDASGEVAFTGDVLVTADDSVGIGAASGGITFTGAVTVGDETKSENKAKVTLHAAGSILQQEVSGNAGVRGSSLEAQSSGGFVKLDAREGGTSGEGGNAFTKAEIESAGDVVFGSTGRTTELAVNASKNGAVSGDLRVQGERGAVIFTNGVSASGEVAVNAAAVHGSDLSADGRLAIVTALEKNAPKGAPQGIVFSGGLSGSIVTVYAGSGDVVIEGPVRSTLGEVDVYRLWAKRIRPIRSWSSMRAAMWLQVRCIRPTRSTRSPDGKAESTGGAASRATSTRLVPWSMLSRSASCRTSRSG